MNLYQLSIGYIISACIMTGIGFIIAYESFSSKTKMGQFFGLVSVFYMIVDFSYLVSVFAKNYQLVSIASSFYFFSMSAMLFFMMRFTKVYTHYKVTALPIRILSKALAAYLIFELIVFAVNPFYEIAVSYTPQSMEIAAYEYQMKPLYYMHLGYAYLLVALIFAQLIYKAVTTPAGAGKKYTYTCIGIFAMVGINAIYLFVPGDSIFNKIDFGVLLYGYLIVYIYWTAFHYTTHGMLDKMRSQVFSSLGQGIALFDYEDRLLLKNERVEQMLPHITWSPELTAEEMVKKIGTRMHTTEKVEYDVYSLQCYPEINGLIRTYRCEYKRIYNNKQKPIGRLFVFSDAELEVDVLTGFHTWSSYHMLVQENPKYYDGNAIIAVFDLNGLSAINKTMGHGAGDQKIQELAVGLRQCIPYAAYFVRDTEANLFAICYGATQQQLTASIQELHEMVKSPFQYAMVSMEAKQEGILYAMDQALNGLRRKKMLDEGAAHSAVLNSMIRMLQECDMDTEEHVIRTRRLGEELAKRMGLNDSQQSELALLCLLHDIGKIGIPLEILNKPGKLAMEEWRMLQTHVEKGSQIANNIEELQDIAGSIRHHHERWDGLGYPDGLRKESIPLLSRIIAVVDAYDAMVHDRVYRKALDTEQAEQELRKSAGNQFDPFIVSEFLQMLEEHPELKGTAPHNHSYQNDFGMISNSQENNSLGNRSHAVSFSRYTLDEDNNFVAVDAFFTAITGYTLEDLQQRGMRQIDLLPPEDRAEYMLLLEKELAERDMAYIEHRILRKDGKVLYVFCYGKRYYDSAAKQGRTEILIADSSDTYSVRTVAQDEREKAQIRLSFWEDTYRSDPLTGVLNRASFQNDTEQQLLSNQYTVMMLMMDVDNFKQYNDCFGHQEGDELLVTAAQTLAAALRKNDIACRMGGDEFAAAFFFPKNCPESTMRERAQQVFDKVMLTLQSVQNVATVSMGAATTNDEVTTFRQLYECADEALYTSKEAGRGRLHFYEKS